MSNQFLTPTVTSLRAASDQYHYRRGVEDAIRILNERGERIRGAVQPDRTEAEIRERLLGA